MNNIITQDTIMEKEKNTLLLDDSEESSSSKIRGNFSMEDIQKLLVDIGSTVSSYKAEQIGIDPENMVKTVRGGRVVWITVEEMNTVLAKQRRLTASKQGQRMLRGENSVSNEISRRADACRSFINEIRKVSPEDSQEFTRSLRTLESLQNLSVSNAREVRVLEAAIQRKRQEDPLLQEMDKATEEMMSALKEDEQADVNVCQSFCDHHMDEYLARQKRLEPYIKKAKEYRLSFLLSKQQLFQFQFDLIERGDGVLTKHIEEIVYYDKDVIFSDQLVQNSNEIRSLLDESRPFFDKLTALSPEELEDQKDLFIEADKNHLNPLFNKMLCFTDLFSSAWKANIEKKTKRLSHAAPDDEKIKDAKRMAFRKKRKTS